MTTLLVLRGLPGAGKSSRAMVWLDEDPETRVRVCRDNIRSMLVGPGHPGILNDEQEMLVTSLEYLAVADALSKGWSVVIDATNLPGEHGDPVTAWRILAIAAGVVLFDVEDLETDVNECIRRDAERGAAGGRHAGEAVIRQLADLLPTRQ